MVRHGCPLFSARHWRWPPRCLSRCYPGAVRPASTPQPPHQRLGSSSRYIGGDRENGKISYALAYGLLFQQQNASTQRGPGRFVARPKPVRKHFAAEDAEAAKPLKSSESLGPELYTQATASKGESGKHNKKKRERASKTRVGLQPPFSKGPSGAGPLYAC